MNVNKAIIYTDGAARGNPGPAAIGVTIRDKMGRPIARISRRIGITTNNQAEYQAIIAALKEAINLGVRHIELYTDSELVVKQINGSYRVKKLELKPLHQQAKQLIGTLEGFTINHTAREQNTEADSLANKALDNA